MAAFGKSWRQWRARRRDGSARPCAQACRVCTSRRHAGLAPHRVPVTRLALLLGGDEVDDLRFRLHLPNDLADLFLRQLRLGEADAVELASRRSADAPSPARTMI